MWSLLLSSVLLSLVYGDDLAYCPPNLPRNTNLRTYNGHCYQFMVHRHIEWKAAENDCTSKGGHLVVVNDMDEQLFLMSALGSFSFRGQGVWIGLTDSVQEGKFTWVSGEPVSFTYWAPGQPGVIANIGRKRLILDTITNIHLVEEDCVLLKFSESGHWHDYPCVKLDPLGLVHENYPYVCEYKQIPPPATTTTVGTTQTMAPSTTQTTTTLTTTPEPDGTPVTSAAVAGSVGELVIGRK
uniref:Neurocan core protein-like n=1 Tax=Crassostrea virginica TaxID=6565 RepID=A0A8B8EMW1_CRAVI|nr:neurocan core protein-like [Crassostrea virginica]